MYVCTHALLRNCVCNGWRVLVLPPQLVTSDSTAGGWVDGERLVACAFIRFSRIVNFVLFSYSYLLGLDSCTPGLVHFGLPSPHNYETLYCTS